MKKYYCIDCDNKVSDYRCKRCRKCADKQHSKRMKGESNPSWIGGLPKCKDCGIKLNNYNAKRCPKCHFKRLKILFKNRIIKWKEKISKTMLKSGTTIGRNNGMFGRPSPHGIWGEYKGILMRSSWEILFAQFLDLSGIKYQYEPKIFDLGNTTYTPDFYIPEFDLYIEIKGYWRDDAKKKFNLFKKNYQDKNIKILTQKKLQELGVL